MIWPVDNAPSNLLAVIFQQRQIVFWLWLYYKWPIWWCGDGVAGKFLIPAMTKSSRMRDASHVCHTSYYYTHTLPAIPFICSVVAVFFCCVILKICVLVAVVLHLLFGWYGDGRLRRCCLYFHFHWVWFSFSLSYALCIRFRYHLYISVWARCDWVCWLLYNHSDEDDLIMKKYSNPYGKNNFLLVRNFCVRVGLSRWWPQLLNYDDMNFFLCTFSAALQHISANRH